MAEMGARIEKLENALEQLSLSSRYQAELAQYVTELRGEVKSTLLARRVVGAIAIACSIALFVGPIWLAGHQYSWFVALPPYVAAALLIGMLAAGVLLLTTVAKSVFRSASERQADDFIPPQIKLIHELMNGVTK